MNSIAETDTATVHTEAAAQFLAFELNAQEFAIDVLQVQEIRNYTRVTPIPNTSQFVKGVMNLRGSVIPIIDLRKKFGFPDSQPNQFTVIIVVNVGDKVMGLVVDTVSDVLDIDEESIEPPPDLGAVNTSFLTGLAKSGERLIALLDVETLLCGQSEDATSEFDSK